MLWKKKTIILVVDICYPLLFKQAYLIGYIICIICYEIKNLIHLLFVDVYLWDRRQYKGRTSWHCSPPPPSCYSGRLGRRSCDPPQSCLEETKVELFNHLNIKTNNRDKSWHFSIEIKPFLMRTWARRIPKVHVIIGFRI